jgi:hypothetical protein
MWHPTPSSIFLHSCMEWCEWRFVGFHPSQCVCGHYVGCSQHPKIECPRLAKVDVKLTTPKGVFCTLDFRCTSIWRWPHFAWAFTWVKQFPFGHFIIESHAHHFKCVHSFEGGSGNKAPLQKSKDNHIWLFLPQCCAPYWGVRWTTISKCMQWSTCQLCTPTSTPP